MLWKCEWERDTSSATRHEQLVKRRLFPTARVWEGTLNRIEKLGLLDYSWYERFWLTHGFPCPAACTATMESFSLTFIFSTQKSGGLSDSLFVWNTLWFDDYYNYYIVMYFLFPFLHRNCSFVNFEVFLLCPFSPSQGLGLWCFRQTANIFLLWAYIASLNCIDTFCQRNGQKQGMRGFLDDNFLNYSVCFLLARSTGRKNDGLFVLI